MRALWRPARWSGPKGSSTVPAVLTMRTLNGRSLALVIAAGSIITSITLGARSTFALFLDPVTNDLGIGRGQFGLAIAIQNILWGVTQPVAGAIADRFGSARTLASGGLGYGLTLMLMSQADTSGAFYLSAGLLIGIATGAASFSIVLASVGRMAPPEKAPMALGIVTAMGSVGQLVMIPTVRALISAEGWRATAVIIGFLALTVVVFTNPLRGRAVDHQSEDSAGAGQAADAVPLRHELRRAAHSRSYLMLNLAFFTCGFHVTFVGTHLVSYATDVGAGRGAGTTALMLIGGFNIVGSLLAGVLGSRFSKTKLLSVIYLLRAALFVSFMLAPVNATSVVIFGAAMGIVWLSTVPLTGGIVAAQFGTTHSGTLFGIVFLAHQAGAFIGAWVGGAIADRSGYEPMFWAAAALAVLAAVLHQLIDEGPAPQPPPVGASRAGVAAATGAAAVVVTGGALAVAAPSDASTPNEASAYVCALHNGG